MKPLLIAALLVGSCFAEEKPCLILAPAPPPNGIATWSRAGAASRHAMIYLAGEYPPGIPFRNQIKDKDVDKIRAKGTQVVILDSQYTRDDLDKAKTSCEVKAAQ